MSKIKIKHFGPIKDGYFNEDDKNWMHIKKVTVFTGSQGSGKSSVAKLKSTMTWLEKALVRGDFKEKDLTKYNRFKKHCEYQKIHTYFKKNTYIEYKGDAYSFKYSNENIKITKNNTGKYVFPKIMYVPAERNFVSAVDKPSSLKKLPLTLYTFLDEFEDSKQNLKEGLLLPINKVKFVYRKQSKISWITGSDYEVRLSEASSGFQSFVPLYLVTRYLAHSINKKRNLSIKEISIEEERRIKKEIEHIYSNPNLSDDVRKVALEELSSRFKYSSFVNIVEEPEQNLFPTSQKSILFELLKYANLNIGNELLLTTHSPYIISYLTLVIKAFFVSEKIEQSANKEELNRKLSSIVPISSLISSSNIAIYEISNEGKISKLGNYNGLPLDENYLNSKLAESNELFTNLIEIEDICK